MLSIKTQKAIIIKSYDKDRGTVLEIRAELDNSEIDSFPYEKFIYENLVLQFSAGRMVYLIHNVGEAGNPSGRN